MILFPIFLKLATPSSNFCPVGEEAILAVAVQKVE
jgi:hypothetical protein